MKRIFAICSCCLLMAAAAQAGSPYYVRPNSSGNNDGTNWANASNDLQAMINQAQAGEEIWVAAGTYKPIYPANNVPTTTPDAGNRNNAFVLKDGVKIYGGFPATGNPGSGDRNWKKNVTILSGDLNGNDDYDAFEDMVITAADDNSRIPYRQSFEDNAYHVVLSVGASDADRISDETVLDGFTVKGGFGWAAPATGQHGNTITVNTKPVPNHRGGGIFNQYSNAKFSNLIITHNNSERGGGIYNEFTESGFSNILIEENLAENWDNQCRGAGVYNIDGASPTFTNVDIRRNNAGNHGGSFGGGIYNSTIAIANISVPVFNNVTITDNRAMHGAGVGNYFESNPVFYNVKIEGNIAQGSGGGVMNAFDTHPEFINVAIINNEDGDATNGGGGIRNEGSGSDWPDVTLTNVTVAGNKSKRAANGGGGIYIDGQSKVTLQNSIVYGNTDKDGNANDVGISSGNNLSVSINSLIGTIGNLGGGTGDFKSITNSVTGNPWFDANYHLKYGSPAMDTGNNGLYNAAWGSYSPSGVDLAGDPRFVGDNIDLGAYENQGSDKVTLTASDFIYAPTKTLYTGSPLPVTVNPDVPATGKITAVKYQDILSSDPPTTTPPTKASMYMILIDVEESDFYDAIEDLELGSYLIYEKENNATPSSKEIDFGSTKAKYMPLSPDTLLLANTGLNQVKFLGLSLTTGEAFVLLDNDGKETTELLSGGEYITVGSWDSIIVKPKDDLKEDCYKDILRFELQFETAPGVWKDTTVTVGIYFCVDPNFDNDPPGIRRRVILPSVPGFKTVPSAGIHYVALGSEFPFTLTPDAPLSANIAPDIRTGRSNLTASEDVTVTPNANGTYTVVVHEVLQDLTLAISISTTTETVASAKVWSRGATLYIYATSAGAAQVYNLTGQLVATLPLTSGETARVTLPAGIYAVKTATGVYKISIR
jgi:hypothetical protein